MQHISLIAHGWLNVTDDDYALPVYKNGPANPRCLICVENHITPTPLPVISRAFSHELRNAYSSHGLYMALQNEGVAKIYEKVAAKLPDHNPIRTLPRQDIYAEKTELCVVQSNRGRIALPVDFDLLANAFIMAGQGAMVEITLADTPCPTTAALDVRRPVFAAAKRSVPLAPKPR